MQIKTKELQELITKKFARPVNPEISEYHALNILESLDDMHAGAREIDDILIQKNGDVYLRIYSM